ncbi:hypothetical protein [uncultured Arcobacter sp.]|uniref:hypothetical protein n=1 Tax=uncultured Arcobacter sp. TaxID=165434 RepID=UPI002629EC96|nr:hypothetical protein [uncultured Arcobacter sp.]
MNCKRCDKKLAYNTTLSYCTSNKDCIELGKSEKALKDVVDFDNETVKCPICGIVFKSLISHIKLYHDMSVDTFKEIYPNSNIYNYNYINNASEKFKGDRNPAYNHGGKLSPWSKKSKYYSEESVKKANKNRTYINRVKYWTDKGYSEQEAHDKISERQTTFSKDICIEKYGDTEGLKRWKERQNKWQTTLKNKSPEEIQRINEKKGFLNDDNHFKSRKDYLNYLIRSKTTPNRLYYNKFLSKNEIIQIIKNTDQLNNKPLKSIKRYLTTKMRLMKAYCEYYDIDLSQYVVIDDSIKKSTHGYGYSKYDEQTGKLLRSSYEIKFCNLLKELGIKYDIEKFYPNSKMKCDFYLYEYDIYIEIAGMMDDIEYESKMYYKRDAFGAIIVTPDYINKTFIKEIING